MLLMAAVALGSGCTRDGRQALLEFTDARTGFIVRHPQQWARVEADDGTVVRFVPPGLAARAAEAAEFIAVFTTPSARKLTDPEIRRTVFTLLPVHGVSGFLQDARTTPAVLWYRFEVTGSTAGTEWASVGVVTAGARRAHVAVCAKPLDQWRTGQQQCDEVVRTFQPGNLNR